MTVRTPVENKQLISLLLIDFTNCWVSFAKKDFSSTEEASPALSKSGDHPAALIAVKYAMDAVNGWLHSEINFCDRGGKTWLMYGGEEYTAKDHTGNAGLRVIEGEAGGVGGHGFDILTLDEAVQRFMPVDTYGAYLIKGFLARLGGTLPKELQHCIDNENEFESPEAAQELRKRSESLREIDPVPMLTAWFGVHPKETPVEAEAPVPATAGGVEKPYDRAAQGILNAGAALLAGAPSLDWTAQANLDEPELRDLEVIIDGMNVFNFMAIPGVSAWLPRIAFVISGDRGANTEGERDVYADAATAIQNIFGLDDNGDQTTTGLLPHANIDRGEAVVQETKDAISAIRHFIERLRTDASDYRITTNVIHLSVKSVDFDLTERTEALWK